MVSVVITTKNEQRNMENCLKSIMEQTFKDFEIIVVDNGSQDRTREIALMFTDKVYERGPERSEQRNFGISKGSGRYVIYLDADMILSPQVIEECVWTAENNQDISGIYIPETVIGDGFWISVRRFERSFYDGTVIDAVRFVPRKLFDEVGGFDTSMCSGEDWDFNKKIKMKGKVAVISACLYHNEWNFNLKRYLDKKSYYGAELCHYVEKWGRDDPDVKKQLGFFYRYLGVFVENGKFLKLLSHPILALGMYYLRFRVGLGYIMAGKKWTDP
ncbi:MAG: glycosyltransferase [Oligoflexales bacterium]|nr:glycosyltransferase [Oligoflexales bacterium]